MAKLPQNLATIPQSLYNVANSPKKDSFGCLFLFDNRITSMMKFFKKISILSIACVSSVSHADNEQHQIQFDLNASLYSPTQSIVSFTDDWEKPLDSGDTAFAHGRVAVNVQPKQQNWQYGVDFRYDYLLKFDQKTAEFYHHYKNKQKLQNGENYPIKIDANHSQRLGVHFGKQWQVQPNWQITANANLWQGQKVVDGYVQGNVQTIENPLVVNKLIDQVHRANLAIDYFYDQPALKEEGLDWYPKKPDGYGYSFDIGVKGELGKNTKMAVNFYDIFGKMHWKNAPTTKYDFRYDIDRPNGKNDYDLLGKLDNYDKTQNLTWYATSQIEHQINQNWQVGLHSEFNKYHDLHKIAVSYQPNLSIQITGLLEPQTHAVGLAVRSKNFGVQWLTDSLNTNKAKRTNVALSAHYAW